MSTIGNTRRKLLAVMLIALMASAQAGAWSPPKGKKIDQADAPATPTTLLKEAHGYITQNGISILENDGYWFAAQMLREWQQELLNGVRYADVKDGQQSIVIEGCAFKNPFTGTAYGCVDLLTWTSWPLAADEHYFNPATGRGLDPGSWRELAASAVRFVTTPLPFIRAGVRPDLANSYSSALKKFREEYTHAVSYYFLGAALEKAAQSRQGYALAMFYLGWASHLMQDQSVVHHTFDEAEKNHNPYESAADGLFTSPPVADGQRMGIYGDQLPLVDCQAGLQNRSDVGPNPPLPTCFPWYAAVLSHDKDVLDRADRGDYSDVEAAIRRAQSLQAGLYAAFLTDIGLPPVHMSAIMAVL